MVYGIVQLINFAHGEVVMVGAMVALSVIAALAGTVAAAAGDRVRRRALRRAGLHGGRVHDGAHCVSAVARRAAAGAADHRDRHLDHPAACRDAHLEPQSAGASRRSSTTRCSSLPARTSAQCRSRSSSVPFLMMAGAHAAGIPHPPGRRHAGNLRESAGRRLDGHQRQSRDLRHLRDRRRPRRGRRCHGRHLLRHRALHDGRAARA